MHLKLTHLSRCLMICCLLCLGAMPATAQKIPLEAWIHDPVITSVGISPDGKHVAALTLANTKDAPDITLWDTSNLGDPPIRFRPKSAKARLVAWLNNDTLFVIARQKFDIRSGGKPTRWFRDLAYLVQLKDRKFRGLLRKRDDIVDVTLEDVLRKDPEHILVKVRTDEFANELFKVNLKRRTALRVFRGATGDEVHTDSRGEVRLKESIEGSGAKVHIRYTYKHPDTGDWERHHSIYAIKREGLSHTAFGLDDSTVYMLDNRGRDKAMLRTYDLRTKKLSAPLYAFEDREVVNVLTSPLLEDYGKVIGYVTAGAKLERVYTAPRWRAIIKKISQALPGDLEHQIVSAADDLGTLVVDSSGPRQPGLYHLLHRGQLLLLGAEQPGLAEEQLADVEFVTYKARDGLEIPAYLTLPSSGWKPYPAVVMPHGGPWARDYDGFDLWAQFLANRGYAVLQPQYRGTMGFGQKLWRAGDNEWGQKMQDDKDDGARWLVEQGIAAADRIAIYGYSYGGYAAMAATVRPNSPFQCAISGAGLSELDSFDKITFTNILQRHYQNPTISGLSPHYVVEQANIPIFVFHGDRDQRVPVIQSRKFVSALKAANKKVKYLEVPDLWHSLPWWPQHHQAVLSSLEDYLAKDCGPNGL